MSLGNMQYEPQMQQQEYQLPQQQHPLLTAMGGNNVAYGQERSNYPYIMNRPLGFLAGAASNQHGYSTGGGSAPSGPGYEPSDGYEQHHHPTGVGGTGYAAPAHPPHIPLPPPLHHPPHHYKKEKHGSVLSALTLLSFFFFLNTLQNCLKEHMDSMNPTMMVLTAGGTRNRYNKLSEMNSREQSSTSPASTFTSGASIQIESDIVTEVPVVTPPPTVKLQTSPYESSSSSSSGNSGSSSNTNSNTDNNNSNKPYNYNNNQQKNQEQQQPHQHLPQQQQQQQQQETHKQHQHFNGGSNNRKPYPELYASTHSYPNRTLYSSTTTYNNDRHHNYYHPRDYQNQYQHYEQSPPAHNLKMPTNDNTYPWTYGPGFSDDGVSANGATSSMIYRRFTSPAISAHISGSNYFNDDRNGDSFHHTRNN